MIQYIIGQSKVNIRSVSKRWKFESKITTTLAVNIVWFFKNFHKRFVRVFLISFKTTKYGPQVDNIDNYMFVSVITLYVDKLLPCRSLIEKRQIVIQIK